MKQLQEYLRKRQDIIAKEFNNAHKLSNKKYDEVLKEKYLLSELLKTVSIKLSEK